METFCTYLLWSKGLKTYAPNARNMVNITSHHAVIITHRIVCGAIFGDKMCKWIIIFLCHTFSANKEIIRYSD